MSSHIVEDTRNSLRGAFCDIILSLTIKGGY